MPPPAPASPRCWKRWSSRHERRQRIHPARTRPRADARGSRRRDRAASRTAGTRGGGADRWRLLSHAAAAVSRRRGTAAGAVHPGDRGAGADQCVGRLVRRAEQRLLDDRGVSGSRGRLRDVRPADRHSGVGTAGRAVRGAAGGWRLSHQRQVALRQRLPSCEVARRAYAGGRDRQGPHHAVPEIQRADARHLAHDRPARHRQQRIRDQGPVRAAALLHLARQSGGAAGGRTAVSFQQQPVVFVRLRRRRPGHRARHDRRLPEPAGQQGVARRVEADAREQRGAVAARAVRGALALGARVPAHDVGDGVGPRRGDAARRPPRTGR